MRKADFHIETTATVILIIIAILLFLILIAGLVMNAENIGGFIADLVGGFF